MNSTDKDEIILKGECVETFEPVKQALIKNFSTNGEIGSAVCIYHEGKKVVDLWGGFMDGEIIDKETVSKLASLPSLDTLRAKIIGSLASSAQKIAGILNKPGGQIAQIISVKNQSDGAT